ELLGRAHVDGFGQQVGLVPEVPVDRTGGDRTPPGDVADRGLDVALLGEHLRGELHEGGPRGTRPVGDRSLVACGLGPCCHGWLPVSTAFPGMLPHLRAGALDLACTAW